MKTGRELNKYGTCECGGAVCFNCWQCVLCTGHLKGCSIKIIAEKEDQEATQIRKRLIQFKKELLRRMEFFDDRSKEYNDIAYCHSRELGCTIELLTEYFGDLE